MASKITITVLFDNIASASSLEAAHGFSCLIEGAGAPILFDTGSDSHILRANAKALGKDLASVETVVLSHPHWDHSGGLFGLMHEVGIRPRVIMPASFSKEFVGHVVHLGAEPTIVEDPCELSPGIHSTGQLLSPDGERARNEHALILETADGSVVITGCAHPGIVNIAKRASQVVPANLTMVLGGFHLGAAEPEIVQASIEALRELGVARVGTSHCTGATCAARFEAVWGDSYVPFICGSVVEIPARS